MGRQTTLGDRLGVALVMAVVALAGGCCETYKCAPPMADLRVQDGAGVDVAAAVVQGEGLVVQRYCTGEGPCRFRITGVAGTATVSAPGYKPVMVALERNQDECGNGLTQHVEIVLATDAAAEPSVSRVTAALGCGG